MLGVLKRILLIGRVPDGHAAGPQQGGGSTPQAGGTQIPEKAIQREWIIEESYAASSGSAC